MFLKNTIRFACGALTLGTLAVAADIQLWDNGPFVTHPGQGAGGADASSVQQNNYFGIGHQIGQNNKAADDFFVPANTKFRVKDAIFYSYQNNSGTTSTITNLSLQIWDGIPGGGGSVVYDGSASNLLNGSVFAGAYRVAPSALTTSTRPIMKSTANIPGGVVLNGGASGKTFWISWQSAGTLTSGPWAMIVSILNENGKPGANARQFIGQTSLWSEIQDPGSGAGYPVPVTQDLVFQLSGRQTEVLAPASYNVVEGFEIGGDLASLGASDDNKLVVFPDDVSLRSVLDITSQATNNTGSTDITVTAEHSVGRPGLTIEGSLKNFSTGNFNVFFSGLAPTSDFVNTVISSNPNYISNTGEIVVRFAWGPVNDEDPASDGWPHSVDYVSYKVGP